VTGLRFLILRQWTTGSIAGGREKRWAGIPARYEFTWHFLGILVRVHGPGIASKLSKNSTGILINLLRLPGRKHISHR